MSAHARLSPSSTAIAYNCPASVQRQEVVDLRAGMLREVSIEFYGLKGDVAKQHQSILSEDNKASADGTELHSIFEMVVGQNMGTNPHKEDIVDELMRKSKLTTDITNDKLLVDKFKQLCNEYRDLVHSDEVDMFEVEKRVKLKGVPQFGTVDLVYTIGRTLYIRDLKTGRNEVSSDDNSQLLTYAVGVCDELGYDKFDTVVIGIIGLRWLSTEASYSIAEIAEYKRDVILLAFMDAYSINPTAKQGKWCQYCSAKLYCPEWVNNHKQSIEGVFMQSMSELSNDELVELFRLGKQTERLLKAELSTELLRRFDTFNEPQGIKRVKGGKVEKWSGSEEDVINALGDKVDNTDLLYKRSLRTPKEVRTLLGDKGELSEGLTTITTKKPYVKL